MGEEGNNEKEFMVNEQGINRRTQVVTKEDIQLMMATNPDDPCYGYDPYYGIWYYYGGYYCYLVARFQLFYDLLMTIADIFNINLEDINITIVIDPEGEAKRDLLL